MSTYAKRRDDQLFVDHLKIHSIRKNKTVFLPGRGCGNTTAYDMDANGTDQEKKARWELHKNAKCCFEQILKVRLHKRATIGPLTSYLTNHPSKRSRYELVSDVLYVDTPVSAGKQKFKSVVCGRLMLSRRLTRTDGWLGRVVRVREFHAVSNDIYCNSRRAFFPPISSLLSFLRRTAIAFSIYFLNICN